MVQQYRLKLLFVYFLKLSYIKVVQSNGRTSGKDQGDGPLFDGCHLIFIFSLEVSGFDVYVWILSWTFKYIICIKRF